MRNDALRASVKRILFDEWDPIGVNDFENCRDEYDSYAPAIARHLREGADLFWLERHLQRLAEDAMGLPRGDPERHRRAAKLLLELVAGAAEDGTK